MKKSLSNGQASLHGIVSLAAEKLFKKLGKVLRIGREASLGKVVCSLVVTVTTSLVVTVANNSEPGETDYGYKYTIHDRPVYAQLFSQEHL